MGRAAGPNAGRVFRVPQTSAAAYSDPMLMRYQLLAVRVLSLVAVAVSAAQLADSLTKAGTFCPFEGDCEAVTASAYGNPLGVPLPVVGVFGFATLFALTLTRGRAVGL